MRRGTKKCILLLLAILLLCLLAWRLTPHTFEEITASDQNAITSLAGAATFLGVRYTDHFFSHNNLLNNLFVCQSGTAKIQPA